MPISKRNVRRRRKKASIVPVRKPPTKNYPLIPEATVHKFTQQGVQRCFGAFYSTRPDVRVRLANEALKHILPLNSVIEKLDFTEVPEVRSPEIRQHYIEGGDNIKIAESVISMQGSYLLFAVPLPDNYGPVDTEIAEAVEACAAFLSLMHGESVATERHFSATYDFQSGAVSQLAQAYFVRQIADNDAPGLTAILDQIEKRDFVYNSTAITLLRRSHHERDSTLKFLFMWLAVEAVLGKGGARRSFALDLMKSEPLDEVINKLRRKRDALLHDGLLIGLDQVEYVQIKCVLMMGLSQSDELRRRLLDYVISGVHIDHPEKVKASSHELPH